MTKLKADLETTGLELIETHISWVLLGDTEVFKIKRPVNLGFLDFTTIEKRRNACEAEVRLNARLAPDVYLGVVPVTRDASGIHLLSGDGEIVDWAVHMRRLPDDERADGLLKAGKLLPKDIDRLAVHIASFHARARCDEETSRHGEVEVVRRNVRENFEQTRGSIEEYLSTDEAHEVEAWQLATLEDEARFAARVSGHRVRDGHGDLRLEHVYFGGDDSIAIIDCIEFNDRFRYADVCADIAFLSMDLAWHGRVDLAERLLAGYARESDDYDLYSVVNFYESYRAFVRGKVSALLAADEEASLKARERAGQEARRYFVLSLAFERPPLVSPRVIAVGGMIASGKSTAADAIGELLAAPVISSDRTRKHLMGKVPTESMKSEAWSGAYSEGSTHEVYDELFRRAGVVVDSGRPVVVDASFRTRAMRQSIREVASQRGIPFSFVECVSPREARLARLKKRELAGLHESDARSELLDEFAKKFEPVVELPGAEHELLDTARPPAETQQRIEQLFS
ncbi:MAG: AAA family ATPase [Myxococcales bacterium]|nr:AAA family ATPase [Myxococcales bacterium]MDH3484403.1 AAA family ATPase [Myxococcales bacterium]